MSDRGVRGARKRSEGGRRAVRSHEHPRNTESTRSLSKQLYQTGDKEAGRNKPPLLSLRDPNVINKIIRAFGATVLRRLPMISLGPEQHEEFLGWLHIESTRLGLIFLGFDGTSHNKYERDDWHTPGKLGLFLALHYIPSQSADLRHAGREAFQAYADELRSHSAAHLGEDVRLWGVKLNLSVQRLFRAMTGLHPDFSKEGFEAMEHQKAAAATQSAQ